MSTNVDRVPGVPASTKGLISVGAVIVSLSLVGAGVLIGRATVEEPAPPARALGLASDRVVTLIDANIAALNAGNEGAYAANWVSDAVFSPMAGFGLTSPQRIPAIRGASKIATHQVRLAPSGGWNIKRTSEVLYLPRLSKHGLFDNGDYAVHTLTCANGTGIAVYELDDTQKIVHEWMIGPSEKYVGGCLTP